MDHTQALNTPPAAGRKGGLLYPTLLIAAIAVILFSVIGIAAMTGLMPSALSKSDPQPASVRESKAPAHTAARAASEPAKSRAAAATATAGAGVCVDCGVVSSIRPLEAAPASSGVGAVAGGVVGGILGNQVGRGRGRTAMTVVGAGAGAYAGNEIEKNMHRNVTYEIRIRMDDGSYRTFFERSQPAFAVGEKVRVRDNGIVAG